MLAPFRSEDPRTLARAADDPHASGESSPNRRVDLVVQRPFVVGERVGLGACQLEQRAIGDEPRVPEVREPGLARAEQLAGPAQLEIDLGQLEAVGSLHERLEARDRGLRELLLGPRDEQAVRLLRASTNTAPKLVQLRKPEAVGLLHDHDRRVRHVDADLDHRRGDEHVELSGLEARHEIAPLGRPQLPVHAADPQPPQLGALQPLGLLLGCPRLDRDRLRHERADDVCLSSRLEVATEAPVRLGATLGRHPARDDRPAAGGQLGDLGHGQVAVHRQRERPRDRRGGHVERVRPRCRRERLALLDAEPMLLVDDRHGQLAQIDARLDERMGADDDRCAGRLLAVALAGRARQEAARDPELRAERLEGEEVLLGERLRGRHERPAEAGLDRSQQCVERDDRLPGADVALEEALHRHRTFEVGVELARSPAPGPRSGGTAAPPSARRRAHPAAAAPARRRPRARAVGGRGRPGARAAPRARAGAAPPPLRRATAAGASREARRP